MHKEFYASGFIYHPATQQILLHQSPSAQETNQWSLFSGKNQGDETPEEAFHRILSEAGIDVPLASCFTVYDYMHREHGVPHFIHYAILEQRPEDEDLETENPVGWFHFKQITKLPLDRQAKQDIVVGQRVINLAIRELEPVSVPES